MTICMSLGIFMITALIIERTYDYFLKRRPILLEKNHNKKKLRIRKTANAVFFIIKNKLFFLIL